jgi:hypothetical protein
LSVNGLPASPGKLLRPESADKPFTDKPFRAFLVGPAYLRAMYSSCLRCDRALGTNTEVVHLSVGRRIAFDTERGRIWVICSACGQWNLTPIEERWEALAECEALARSAEATSAGAEAALAQTASGLELLRVGGMSYGDIANWRYGLRAAERQRRQRLMLMPLAGLSIGLGLAAWTASHAPIAGVWTTLTVAVMSFILWLNGPRPWRRFTDGVGRRRFLWPWQVSDVRIIKSALPGGPTELVVPRFWGEMRLRDLGAARALASLLPQLSGAECSGVVIENAVKRVTAAEQASRKPRRNPGRAARRRARPRNAPPPVAPRVRRPWELLLGDARVLYLTAASPERRVALEMAVTEEVEQRELQARTEQLTEEWVEEEEIGAISDDLLVADDVRERMERLKSAPPSPLSADRQT